MNKTKMVNENSCECDCECNTWKILAFFLLGVIIGFLISPIKKGVSICSSNNLVDNTISGGTIGEIQEKKDEEIDI